MSITIQSRDTSQDTYNTSLWRQPATIKELMSRTQVNWITTKRLYSLGEMLESISKNAQVSFGDGKKDPAQ